MENTPSPDAQTPPSFDVSIIVPAYNEAKGIARTLGEIRSYFQRAGLSCEIIVSADGTDGTRELVADLAKNDPTLRVIGSAQRRGKGYGVRSALALARGGIIGYVDADNKTPIEEFEKLQPFLREGYGMAIGSRRLPEATIEKPAPWYRRWGAKGFSVFLHALVELPDIADTQCGFKFFSRRAALDLFSRQKIDGYMFDIELLCLAQASGYRIAEVPVRWRDDGDSRLDLLRGNIRNAVDVLRIRSDQRRRR